MDKQIQNELDAMSYTSGSGKVFYEVYCHGKLVRTFRDGLEDGVKAGLYAGFRNGGLSSASTACTIYRVDESISLRRTQVGE